MKNPNSKRLKAHSLIILLALILCISPVLAFLETSKPLPYVKGQPIVFDGKEVAYNPIWDKYAPINNMVIIQ
jgi:hypothetical protein